MQAHPHLTSRRNARSTVIAKTIRLSLRGKSTKKYRNISGQHFAQTFRTRGSTKVLYLFSVVFCTEQSVMGTTVKNVQTLRTLSVVQFLCTIRTKSRYSFFQFGTYSTHMYGNIIPAWSIDTGGFLRQCVKCDVTCGADGMVEFT